MLGIIAADADDLAGVKRSEERRTLQVDAAAQLPGRGPRLEGIGEEDARTRVRALAAVADDIETLGADAVETAQGGQFSSPTGFPSGMPPPAAVGLP